MSLQVFGLKPELELSYSTAAARAGADRGGAFEFYVLNITAKIVFGISSMSNRE